MRDIRDTRFQDVVVRIAPTDFDERTLDEMERYTRWLDLAQELSAQDTRWLPHIT